MQSEIRKNKWRILIACTALFIINIYPYSTKFYNVEAKDNNTTGTFPKHENIGVFATVDLYLAVYKKLDGNIRAETNAASKYFADESVCVINY